MGAALRLEHPELNAAGRGGLESYRFAHYIVKEVYTAGGTSINYVLQFSSRTYEQDLERDAEKVRARALKKLKQRIMALPATHMLTLTYRENVTSLEQSRADLTAFLAIVRKKLKKWKFVGVAEYQERGAVHWHLAVNGFQDVRFLRFAWRAVVGEDGGNIDVKFFSGKSSGVIAEYISKYLGKGFDLGDKPRYSHYYVTSRGLVVETSGYKLVGYTQQECEDFMRGLMASRAGKVRSRWWIDDGRDAGGIRTW